MVSLRICQLNHSKNTQYWVIIMISLHFKGARQLHQSLSPPKQRPWNAQNKAVLPRWRNFRRTWVIRRKNWRCSALARRVNGSPWSLFSWRVDEGVWPVGLMLEFQEGYHWICFSGVSRMKTTQDLSTAPTSQLITHSSTAFTCAKDMSDGSFKVER